VKHDAMQAYGEVEVHCIETVEVRGGAPHRLSSAAAGCVLPTRDDEAKSSCKLWSYGVKTV